MAKSVYKQLPSAKIIRETFDYCPDTGVLKWKARTVIRSHFDNAFNTQFAGKPTGCQNGRGYLRVLWNYEHFVAHRIIWKWWHGTDALMLDHINGDRSDNRIANLRECERSQNNANSKQRKSASGVRGVSKNGKRWQANIRKDNEGIYLGTFDTPEEAHKAYCKAAKELHGEFARFG